MLKLYHELASWMPLMCPLEEYRQEAAVYHELLSTALRGPIETMLDLGSGGGNNAYFLKKHARMTLVDISPAMLEVSRSVNPECEHVPGDMYTLRLERAFDAVLVHDAIMYATTESDLRRVMETAFVHCRPGGAALFAPDCVRETFKPATEHGGCDDGDRGMRYLAWTYDPDPTDTIYENAHVYMLREGDSVRIENEVHKHGLFPRETWLRLLQEVGFDPRIVHDRRHCDVFVCRV